MAPVVTCRVEGLRRPERIQREAAASASSSAPAGSAKSSKKPCSDIRAWTITNTVPLGSLSTSIL